VQYKAGDTLATNNEIKPFLQLLNTSPASVPLAELKARYWYTWEGTTQGQAYFCDYAFKGCANITASFIRLSPARPGADSYLELGFTSGAGSLAAGASSGEIQSRFAKSDWSNYNETGDYSFDQTRTAYADWGKVTLYRSGTLAWGVEP
jgi:hypothetical protein